MVDWAELSTLRAADTGAVAAFAAGRGGMGMTYLVPMKPDFDRTQNKTFIEALQQRATTLRTRPDQAQTLRGERSGCLHVTCVSHGCSRNKRQDAVLVLPANKSIGRRCSRPSPCRQEAEDVEALHPHAADKFTLAFRADPAVQVALTASPLDELAQPTADQLAMEHLLGVR
ncbi:hypothetical protein ACFRFL_30960 [Streptomyces sp. NPDC056708]|uniref:hypothetical protein n=1 Tax=unclassified Streptomyces TaxID=2593676 RepID=UPI00368B4F1B